jgi:hypothetical protein
MSRLLSSLEEDSRLATVRREWSWFGNSWYPQTESSRRDVLAFEVELVQPVLPEPALRTLLKEAGVNNVFWFPAQDPTVETRLEQLDTLYGMAAAFLVDESLKWIIYLSGEGTITFGGSLVGPVKAAVADWDRLQTSWGDGDLV